MSLSHLYFRVDVLSFQDKIASAWGRLISKDRDIWFLVAIFASSFVAFLPFSRDTSISNFLVYALLPIILVFANRKKFEEVATPSFLGLLAAAGMTAGSFVFNWVTGVPGGNYTFGLTDYVILACGVFALFYSVEERVVQFGITLLVILRGATLALSMASSALFDTVSGFLIWIVLVISKAVVSPTIEAGSTPGRIVIEHGGIRNEVGIGWACAGLEELVIISAIIYILIDSFKLGPKRTAYWLTLGIAGSFVINIVRMVILVWVAFNYGIDDMLWVHTHLGDALFLVWMAVFWVIFFKIAVKKAEASQAPPAAS